MGLHTKLPECKFKETKSALQTFSTSFLSYPGPLLIYSDNTSKQPLDTLYHLYFPCCNFFTSPISFQDGGGKQAVSQAALSAQNAAAQ